MKRLILSLLTLLTVVNAWAYDFKADNADGKTIYYNILSSSECEVTYYRYPYHNSIYEDNIVIPSSVSYNGKSLSVTKIGSYAFNGCGHLTSITIPNTVTSIGEGAFYANGGLTSLTIPNSVTTIGSSAFYGCGITSITIPNSVTQIGSTAFRDCSDLNSISIPSSITTIEKETFRGCTKLTSITIPNSITAIGEYAFYD